MVGRTDRLDASAKLHEPGVNRMTIRIPRRTLLKGALGTAVVAPLSGFPYIARAAEPLVINTFGGDFEKFMRAEVVPDFEKQTGIKTKLDVGLATNWIASCRAAGPENPPFDVLMLNAIWAALLRTEGYFEKIPASKVPNLADVFSVARYPDDIAVAGWFQPMGVAYSPDSIKQAPSGWKDIWDNPELKGNTGLYTITNTAGMMFLLMTAQMYGGSQYKTDVAFEQIRKLKPFLQIDFSGTMETMLTRGEVAAGPLDFAAVTRLRRQGVNLAINIPKEGSFAFDQVFNVLKGSKKKEQAYAWIDYILSPTVQLKWVNGFFVSPSNTKAPIPEGLKAEIPFAGDAMKSLVTFDWASANKNRDKIIERWNKEMS
jgi:putative spermidine/putrescine transport system substrate-binding protein